VSKNAKERGQSLVEVAITMPILLLIVMSILDLGRAYYASITLSDAAAEGAAYAALHPSRTVQIIERVADGSNPLVVIEPETVSVYAPDTTPGRPVTVTIEYDYEILTPLVNGFLEDGKIVMKARAVQSIITQ
jgi:hypothetical protein